MTTDGATPGRNTAVSSGTATGSSTEREAYVSQAIDFLLLLAVSIPVALAAGAVLLP